MRLSFACSLGVNFTDVTTVSCSRSEVLRFVLTSGTLHETKRKCQAMKSHFRAGTSRNANFATTFRAQMADYARGERLTELREKQHLSREDAAHEIGVSSRTLYAWERRNAPIKWENAQAAARFYDVEADSLVSRERIGSDQLDRIESKLDELLLLVAGTDVEAAERVRRRLAAAAAQAGARPEGTQSNPPAHHQEGQAR